MLALIYRDVKRVYPLQILIWHEIVNDEIAGTPILVTYCPLCGSGIAYERTPEGEAVEFGEVIVKERGFWFAWYAFHPGTELYGA